VPEWAAARDGGGSAVDWDGWMGAQRREAVAHERGMGETSFRGDLVVLDERREWSEASGLLDVLLMVALSFTITSKYTQRAGTIHGEVLYIRTPGYCRRGGTAHPFSGYCSGPTLFIDYCSITKYCATRKLVHAVNPE
jgi:hypothetical protein